MDLYKNKKWRRNEDRIGRNGRKRRNSKVEIARQKVHKEDRRKKGKDMKKEAKSKGRKRRKKDGREKGKRKRKEVHTGKRE